MAAAVGGRAAAARVLAPDQDLPPEYWRALMGDPRADGVDRAGMLPSPAACNPFQHRRLLLFASSNAKSDVRQLTAAAAIRLARWTKGEP
ncbi:hypothetical protein [Bradyrhizobium uaiense]|uniref:Uncharacterized protein n=1 Tax=Bradyrhizobium uaiense TaxID=2594946 RepID=A0A6P1BXJ8_9BRAD|nr:hypothetical protein [Bradyrhizobium uaiense]NEV02431.1 hypothetical protein [Bradyrhizobium uaiense]